MSRDRLLENLRAHTPFTAEESEMRDRLFNFVRSEERCFGPAACATTRPAATSPAIRVASSAASDPRPSLYTQGLAVEELGDQVRPSIEDADIEDLDDVCVVEPGGDACLLQEPFDALSVVRAGVGQKLQSHVPLQAHVGRAVDVAHAPARHQGDNSIRSDKRIDVLEQRVILGEIAGRERERRRFEEAPQPRASRRQRVRLRGQVRMAFNEVPPQTVAFVGPATSQALCQSDSSCHRSVLILHLER